MYGGTILPRQKAPIAMMLPLRLVPLMPPKLGRPAEIKDRDRGSSVFGGTDPLGRSEGIPIVDPPAMRV